MCQLGCDINTHSDTGHTPLHVMLQKDRRDCIMELLIFGADTRKIDNCGNTPLHIAVQVIILGLNTVFPEFINV